MDHFSLVFHTWVSMLGLLDTAGPFLRGRAFVPCDPTPFKHSESGLAMPLLGGPS